MRYPDESIPPYHVQLRGPDWSLPRSERSCASVLRVVHARPIRSSILPDPCDWHVSLCVQEPGPAPVGDDDGDDGDDDGIPAPASQGVPDQPPSSTICATSFRDSARIVDAIHGAASNTAIMSTAGLRITRRSSLAKLKLVYKKIVLLIHPDKLTAYSVEFVGKARDAFNKVHSAYQALSAVLSNDPPPAVNPKRGGVGASCRKKSAPQKPDAGHKKRHLACIAFAEGDYDALFQTLVPGDLVVWSYIGTEHPDSMHQRLGRLVSYTAGVATVYTNQSRSCLIRSSGELVLGRLALLIS